MTLQAFLNLLSAETDIQVAVKIEGPPEGATTGLGMIIANPITVRAFRREYKEWLNEQVDWADLVQLNSAIPYMRIRLRRKMTREEWAERKKQAGREMKYLQAKERYQRSKQKRKDI